MQNPSPLFDWKMVALSTWLVCGILMDGWAHNHISEELETFFTPWHAVLYSGYLAVAVFTIATLIRNYRKRASWKNALPPGYGLTLLGVLIFGVSGIGDLIWHSIFGIETSVSGGFSPSHLGIMIGIGLIVSGPFRAVWMRSGPVPERWKEWLPALLSMHLTLTLMSFVTQYASPLVVLEATTVPSAFADQALGAVSIMLQTAIFMGWILLVVQRWKLPLGSLTIILVLNTIAMCFMRDQFFLIPAIALAGISADLLLWKLKPSPSRPIQFHIFAFAVPVLYFILYFSALLIAKDISWPVPLWSGTIVMAGIVSVLLSYLIVPPASPHGF